MRKSILVLFTLLITTSPILAACASTTPAPQETPAETTAPAPPPAASASTLKDIELKYDDGRPDGSMAIGQIPGRGHLVRFSVPATPFTISSIRIFGSLYGTAYEDLSFTAEILGNDLKEIFSTSLPHTEFSTSAGWLEIEIPRITVTDDFYIHIYTQSPREGGLNILYDSSIPNTHSEVTLDWEIADWYLQVPKEQVNWMVRVIGTQATGDR